MQYNSGSKRKTFGERASSQRVTYPPYGGQRSMNSSKVNRRPSRESQTIRRLFAMLEASTKLSEEDQVVRSTEARVSIVIPCYNHGRYLREALDSVEGACVAGVCEVIVVDDGSTDVDTIRIVDELEEGGIRIIRQPNAGLARARNVGIRA